MDNLELWDRRSHSDPANLKKVEFGRKFISIDPQSQLLEATSEWGPWGTGFGIKSPSFEFVRDETGHIVSVLAWGTFWYKDEAGVHECNTASDITPFYSKAGKPEEDYAKKLMTSMVSKELSRLGFNADVFMGKWDGCPYIGKGAEDKGSPAKAEQWADQKHGSGASSKANAVPPPQAKPSQAPDPEAPLAKKAHLTALVVECDNVDDLKAVWAAHKDEAGRLEWRKTFDELVKERKAEILAGGVE